MDAINGNRLRLLHGILGCIFGGFNSPASGILGSVCRLGSCVLGCINSLASSVLGGISGFRCCVFGCINGLAAASLAASTGVGAAAAGAGAGSSRSRCSSFRFFFLTAKRRGQARGARRREGLFHFVLQRESLTMCALGESPSAETTPVSRNQDRNW